MTEPLAFAGVLEVAVVPDVSFSRVDADHDASWT